MKVLFIGGTGVISQACVELACRRGIDLTLVNRGRSESPAPDGVKTINADVRDRGQFKAALNGLDFDVVVNWIAYAPEHVAADIELFAGRVSQYIFISSASAYQKPPANYVITESTPLHNPFWEYSRNKIACELQLMDAYRQSGFPTTIVRPSYTYNSRMIPNAIANGGYGVVARMKAGEPVVVHGDGQSLWTMTHNSDFAKGFVGLLGNPQTLGESYHITSDEVLTWDQIYRTIGQAAGVVPTLVHVPSEVIAMYDPAMGAGLLGDKSCTMVFDNSKIKRLVPDFRATVPFAEGMRRSITWFHADPARMVRDAKSDELQNRILAAWQKIKP